MKPSRLAPLLLLLCAASPLVLQAAAPPPPEYIAVKSRLARGWNTWDSRNVLSQVHLPSGLAFSLAFKQHAWIDERYLKTALIGLRGEDEPRVRPLLHTLDGAYTALEIRWLHLAARVESAVRHGRLFVLVTPLQPLSPPVRLVVESGMLWNRPGTLQRNGDSLHAGLPAGAVDLFWTARHEDHPYVDTQTPYLSALLDGPIGLCTAAPAGLEEIRTAVEAARGEAQAGPYDDADLDEAWRATRSILGWNTVYDPREERVVTTVGRLWNREYGGYCLFGWDNFFLSFLLALYDKDLAQANVIEHLAGATEEGFIANDNAGNGRKTWDHSQPPVGSLMVREIVRRHPDPWFLRAVFDGLLAWNRWWPQKRMNDGLLSYGSHPSPNPFQVGNVHTKTAAGYESGLDDSPMYRDVPFSAAKNTLELQDVGLNSLYIADCRALAELAGMLGRRAEMRELRQRAADFSRRLDALWDERTGMYLNRRTDTHQPSIVLSPTLFYPLLAGLPAPRRAARMVSEHLLNPREFGGEWVIPSVARDDADFPRQRYWKGAIWPPLNFLVYLGLANYPDHSGARRELAANSLRLFLGEWRRLGCVAENYSAITGTCDDQRLSSDPYHSWGALLAAPALIERERTDSRAGKRPASGR